MEETMQSGMLRFVIFAMAMLVFTLAVQCTDSAPPESVRLGIRSTTILYVDEPRFDGPDDSSARENSNWLYGKLQLLMPDVALDWRLVTVNPDRADQLERALQQYHPTLVILANTGLAELIGATTTTTSYLVGSELPPATIQARFAALRTRHKVAFVSWYASNQNRILDLLIAVGGNLHRIATFYDDSAMEEGISGAFEEACELRGIETVQFRYDSFDRLRQILSKVSIDKPDGLFLPITGTLFANNKTAADLVGRTGLPAAFSVAKQVEEGGLVTSAGRPTQLYEQIESYAVLIIHGANASNLDIAEPTIFETTVNLNAAKRISRVIPYEILIEANEVIE